MKWLNEEYKFKALSFSKIIENSAQNHLFCQEIMTCAMATWALK